MITQEKPLPNDLIINAGNAPVLYAALQLAIGDTKDTLERDSKNIQQFKQSLKMMLASYETERARIAAAFPEVAR